MIEVATLSLGADPEGFFASGDKIVGAEKVLPAKGLGDFNGSVVLDGVQFELHPQARPNIPDLAVNLSKCFSSILTRLKTLNGQFRVDFSQVVTVDREELASLSEAARTLGCQPSHNFYKVRPIKVKKDFPVRSAAGHIHMGLKDPIFGSYAGQDYRRNLVPLLDIIVGNTCVMIDRDPMAAERRKLYGHAGEFRTPRYGLEYRTTSNFWLKSFSLMELTFGLTVTAVSILHTSLNCEKVGKDYNPEAALAELVNIKDIEKAIEKNDAKLAWKNWQSIRKFFLDHVPVSPHFPINSGNLDQVDKFLEIAANDKLAQFLPPDPLAHWTDIAVASPQDVYGYRKHTIRPGNGWLDLLKIVTA